MMNYCTIGAEGITFSNTPPKFERKNELPKKAYFNKKKKTTVLLWEDNSKTIVKTHDEKYDRRTGFLIAYFQKNCGLSKNKSNKYLEKIIEEGKK